MFKGITTQYHMIDESRGQVCGSVCLPPEKMKGEKMEITKVLKVRRYKIGYEVRTELIDSGNNNDDFTMKSAYNSKGDYIGSSRDAHRLCFNYGIIPEKISPKNNVCSIGFSKKNNKWYGWSHRALYGFKIGDSIKKGDCAASSGFVEEYLKEHPEENKSLPIGFKAKTLEDCKKMAIAFACSVS